MPSVLDYYRGKAIHEYHPAKRECQAKSRYPSCPCMAVSGAACAYRGLCGSSYSLAHLYAISYLYTLSISNSNIHYTNPHAGAAATAPE